MFAGRAGGTRVAEEVGRAGRIVGRSGSRPCRPGRSDLAVRGYTRVPGRLGFPPLLGISSVASTPVLCRVRMKRC